jgi:hypothetical protein
MLCESLPHYFGPYQEARVQAGIEDLTPLKHPNPAETEGVVSKESRNIILSGYMN